MAQRVLTKNGSVTCNLGKQLFARFNMIEEAQPIHRTAIHGQVIASQKFLQHLLALLLQLTLLATKYGLYLGLRLGGSNMIHPFWNDLHITPRENFHLITALKTM